MTDRRPHEPTSPAQPATQGRDGTPPPPPQELPAEPEPLRQFESDNRMWVARLSGKGACGTGSYGLGLVEAVHFCDAARPDRPLFEALLARGRFASLYDSELVTLLRRAVPVTGSGDA